MLREGDYNFPLPLFVYLQHTLLSIFSMNLNAFVTHRRGIELADQVLPKKKQKTLMLVKSSVILPLTGHNNGHASC